MLKAEQAILFVPAGVSAGRGPSWWARSLEWRECWDEPALALAAGFGERPDGVACPEAVFAQPLDRQHVTVVRVADQPTGLGFQFVVMTREDYLLLGADPFAIANKVPPAWERRGAVLSSVHLSPPDRLPAIAEIANLLRSPQGPTLLGAVQALLDGSRAAWVRPAPDPELLQSLWQLLPIRSRAEMWPASFAFSNRLQFHALVVPRIQPEEYDFRYLSAAQVDNYPEGRYEAQLQSAAETGDQALWERLLLRRSHRDTLRLGFWLLAGMLALSIAMGVIKIVQGR
jgi:hypothetical protein